MTVVSETKTSSHAWIGLATALVITLMAWVFVSASTILAHQATLKTSGEVNLVDAYKKYIEEERRKESQIGSKGEGISTAKNISDREAHDQKLLDFLQNNLKEIIGKSLESINGRVTDSWSAIQGIGIISGLIGVLMTVVVLYFSFKQSEVMQEVISRNKAELERIRQDAIKASSDLAETIIRAQIETQVKNQVERIQEKLNESFDKSKRDFEVAANELYKKLVEEAQNIRLDMRTSSEHIKFDVVNARKATEKSQSALARMQDETIRAVKRTKTEMNVVRIQANSAAGSIINSSTAAEKKLNDINNNIQAALKLFDAKITGTLNDLLRDKKRAAAHFSSLFHYIWANFEPRNEEAKDSPPDAPLYFPEGIIAEQISSRGEEPQSIMIIESKGGAKDKGDHEDIDAALQLRRLQSAFDNKGDEGSLNFVTLIRRAIEHIDKVPGCKLAFSGKIIPLLNDIARSTTIDEKKNMAAVEAIEAILTEEPSKELLVAVLESLQKRDKINNDQDLKALVEKCRKLVTTLSAGSLGRLLDLIKAFNVIAGSDTTEDKKSTAKKEIIKLLEP